MGDVRRLDRLTRDESLRLLRSVSLGRVVFTHLALPAIRPVNHLVDGEEIIIRANQSATITAILGVENGSVVAYEADTIDPGDHLGWSVIVVGRARHVTGEAERSRYLRTLPPWVTGTYDDIIGIRTDMVDGFRVSLDSEGG